MTWDELNITGSLDNPLTDPPTFDVMVKARVKVSETEWKDYGGEWRDIEYPKLLEILRAYNKGEVPE